MTIPVPKVEIGFDITGANAPFFTLDDSIKGRLDNTDYRLSGSIFYDVTEKVRSIAIRRGKNRQLDEFDPGLANIVFDNNDRTFDPEYALSPYAGQIIPRRAVRISSGGQQVFVGTIDDWNLQYSVDNISEASAACSDAFSLFNDQLVPAGTAVAELTGQRINKILNLKAVNWPTQDRSIETGTTIIGANVLQDETNALDYLRQIARSEPGQLFMGKDGKLIFKDNQIELPDDLVVFSDDGTGIGYREIKVVYGSELLYNRVILQNVFGDTATATDLASAAQYGSLTFNRNDLLTQNPSDLADQAVALVQNYSQPEYRFESVNILLDNLNNADQERLLALEIGDIVRIKFTPNKIPPVITKLAEVIRIDQDIAPSGHVISFGFSTLDFDLWTLSGGELGRLSAGNVLR